MNFKQRPICGGFVLVTCRYMNNGTTAIADRLWQYYRAKGLVTDDRLGEAVLLAKQIASTISMIFDFDQQNESVPSEVRAAKEFWLFVDTKIVIARREDGTPLDFAQDEALLAELWRLYNEELGTEFQEQWWAAYNAESAKSAVKPTLSIAHPSTLTAEQLNDPNLQPPGANTVTASGL